MPGSPRREKAATNATAARRPGVGGLIALVAIAVAVLVATVAVLSLHGPAGSVSRHPGASTVRVAVTAGSVERAILRQKNAPRPTAASCRAPTSSERAAASIGGADSVFFSCEITLGGQSARFYVQVLADGSFIAENEGRPQDQMFACCVAQTR